MLNTHKTKAIVQVGLISIAFLLLLSLVPLVVAADFDIGSIYINDIPTGSSPEVYPGDELKVTIWIPSNSNTEVKTRVWITGYPYADIEEKTEQFTINADVVYKKELYLNLPEDLEPGENYILHVEVYNKDYSIEKAYSFMISQQAHSLNINDIIMQDSVDEGSLLHANLRVKNTGWYDEDDVSVDMIIEDLNINSRVYIDEIKKDDTESVNTYLTIPKNTLSGYYEIKFVLNYENGHKKTVTYEHVYVDGSNQEIKISADFPELEYSDNQEVVVTVMNLGEERSFNLVITSGNAKTQTPEITIKKNDIGELTFTLIQEDSTNLTISLYSEEVLLDSRSYELEKKEMSAMWFLACTMIILLVLTYMGKKFREV